MQKGIHLHTKYGELKLEVVPNTGRFKVALHGQKGNPKQFARAEAELKKYWAETGFRAAFRKELYRAKDHYKNYPYTTAQQRNALLRKLDAMIEVTKNGPTYPRFR